MKEVTKNDIEHLGRVTAIDDEKITISIVSKTGCVSCSVKGSCSVGDVEEKIVEVANKGDRHIDKGQIVTVVLDMKSGAMAVMLGYVFPFLVMFITLISMTASGYGEGTSGLVSIAMLIPYYLILYLNRRNQSRQFSFRLK